MKSTNSTKYRKSGKLQCTVLVVLVGAVAAIGVIGLRREQSLVERGRLEFRSRERGLEACYWLSDHVFVGEIRSDSGSLRLLSYNTATGVEGILTSKPDKLARSGMFRSGVEYEMRRETLVKQRSTKSGDTYLPFGDSTLRLPPDTRAIEYNRSHVGGRIAWMMKRRCIPIWEIALHRVFSPYKIPTQPASLEVWTSDSKGGHMSRLGAVGPESPGTDYALQWLPSDKRLSLIYQGSLYSFGSDLK